MNPLDPSTWPEPMRYEQRERACIREYCGGQERDAAEEAARVEVLTRHGYLAGERGDV